jgi:hypothetical protein
MVPGLARQPLKKIDPDAAELLRVLRRWRDEAVRSGATIDRIVVAYEAGRDGFWLARWLWSHEIETYVIHSTSVAVSREHRRAKSDRLDTAMLLRVFLGWLRGESGHCLAVPHIPKGKRLGAMVPRPDRGAERHAQDDHDCRPRAQTAHRHVANGHGWCDPRWRAHSAGGGVNALKTTDHGNRVLAPGRDRAVER